MLNVSKGKKLKEYENICQMLYFVWLLHYPSHTHHVVFVLLLKIIKTKIEEYKQELAIFAESFNMHGPGAVGDNLDKGNLSIYHFSSNIEMSVLTKRALLLFPGLTVMAKYEADFARMELERQDLKSSEKLLDLPISMHPEATRIQKDMMALRQIYDIYADQKVG